MFKRIALLSLCAILLVPLFVSCQDITDTNTGNSTTSAPTLDAELELKIREDYLQRFIDLHGESENWNNLKDISVWWYGNYSGCEAVRMWNKRILTLRPMTFEVEIAGYTFVFTVDDRVYVYKDSEFYTLKEAYDAKLITQNDVYNIWLQLNQDFAEQNSNPKR